MSEKIPELFKAEKTLPMKPDWKESGADWLRLTSTLDVEGVTIEGLRLEATCLKIRPMSVVTFLILYAQNTRVKHEPIARIDWKPLHTHNNKENGPQELKYTPQNGSHHHSFELNWLYQEQRMRSAKANLPIAKPIIPEPANFNDLLTYVSKEFNISNLNCVQIPPWEERLL